MQPGPRERDRPRRPLRTRLGVIKRGEARASRQDRRRHLLCDHAASRATHYGTVVVASCRQGRVHAAKSASGARISSGSTWQVDHLLVGSSSSSPPSLFSYSTSSTHSRHCHSRDVVSFCSSLHLAHPPPDDSPAESVSLNPHFDQRLARTPQRVTRTCQRNVRR